MELTIEQILEGAKSSRWLTDPAALFDRRAQRPLTNEEAAVLLDRAQQSMSGGYGTEAIQLLFAGLVLDDLQFLRQLQKAGLFRLSRYSYAEGAATSVSRALVGSGTALSPQVRAYLESVVNLHAIARSIRKEYDVLVTWLVSEREAGVKGALATLDWIFLKQAYESRLNGNVWGVEDSLYEPEQLAEGFSTILAIYVNQFGPLRGNVWINAEAAAAGAYVPRLFSGANIAAYREWELLVDRMDYHVTTEPDGTTFHVLAASTEFHRAMQLGFIHTHAQRSLIVHDVDHKNVKSFIAFGHELADKDWNRHFVKLVHDPVPRYRFEFPEELLALTRDIGDLLREELISLTAASRDLLASVAEVLAFELTKSVTMRDLFLVSRLLQFMRCILAEKLLSEAKNNLPLVLQSLIRVFERDTLRKLFGLVVGEENAKAVLDLLLLDFNRHIDIQYQPLIPAGVAVLMPVNVLANSNIYRNPLVISRRRLYEDGQIDPVSDAIRKVFEDKGFAGRSHVAFSWRGVSGEVDVIVVVDDILLALECKNSLLPTGVHELITSWDYVETASEQLGRFAACFREPTFRDDLTKNTRLQIPGSVRLITGIVMANRMFIGYRHDGHAVRGKSELEQFVANGTITIGTEEKAFWVGSSLCGEDLRRFFEEDITYRPQWNALAPICVRYELGGCTIVTKQLALNVLDMARELGLKAAEAEMLRKSERTA